MTEILLLGTFHYMESPIDFYSPEVQKELDMLVSSIALFQPDAVAVEAAVDAQSSIDEAYVRFRLEDLQNGEKMQTETLGEIFTFGQRHPICYNSESVQIGFRLGKLLGHDKIYAIDDDSLLDMEVLKHPTLFLEDAMNVMMADVSRHEADSIAELYKYYNSTGFSKMNHSVYIQANAIRTKGRYDGAEMVAKWYERNLKIFANIQRLAEKKKRLFVLYGAGHLQIIRDLINADDHLKLSDIYTYL